MGKSLHTQYGTVQESGDGRALAGIRRGFKHSKTRCLLSGSGSGIKTSEFYEFESVVSAVS